MKISQRKEVQEKKNNVAAIGSKVIANVTIASDDGRRINAHKHSKPGLDLTETRATEWRNVKRVVTRNNNEENEEVRRVFVKEELLKTVDEYMKTSCDKSGKLKSSNLSNSSEKSLKVFKKRISDENLTVYETDKTGKLVVDTLDNYEHKMQKHIVNDEILNLK